MCKNILFKIYSEVVLLNIEVKNITKRYKKKTVLDNVSFKLEPGVTAIVGHNGAGKSTIFNILCGRVKKFDGQIVQDDEQYKKNILFEEAFFYPHLTARENLQYLNYCNGEKLNDKQIDELMAAWDVCTDKNKSLSHYSLGMKKRYAIAVALLNDPDILILDEPLNGLDVDAQKLVKDLISLYRDKNKIVVFSSHQMESVVSMADRVIILHKGSIKLDCPLKSLNNISDFIEVDADKSEITPFIDESYMNCFDTNGDMLRIKIKNNRIYDFLKIVIDNKLNIYKMESLLPSLYDILKEIEDDKK